MPEGEPMPDDVAEISDEETEAEGGS